MKDSVFDEICANLDKMEEMKRYRAPTHGYFPTVAEINTYAMSNKKHIVPYLMWLDSNLTPEQRAEHRDAVNRLNEIIEEMDDEGEEEEV